MQNVMQAHIDIVHGRPVESILCPSGKKGCLPQRQPSLKDGQEQLARSPRAIEAAVSWALSTAACNCDRERLLWMVGRNRLQGCRASRGCPCMLA